MIYEYFGLLTFILTSAVAGLSFYRKSIWPNGRNAMIAILMVAVPFIVLDSIVTGRWWDFHPDRVLGIYFLNLPIEEILFFFVVPWSCLAIWVNLKEILKGKYKESKLVSYLLIVLLLLVSAVTYLQKLEYTSFVFLLTSALIYISRVKNWWWSKAFLVFIFVYFVLTFVFNGYLTGRPIVVYSDDYFTGIRTLTVPIEDYFFGLGLIGFTVYTYEKLQTRSND